MQGQFFGQFQLAENTNLIVGAGYQFPVTPQTTKPVLTPRPTTATGSSPRASRFEEMRLRVLADLQGQIKAGEDGGDATLPAEVLMEASEKTEHVMLKSYSHAGDDLLERIDLKFVRPPVVRFATTSPSAC